MAEVKEHYHARPMAANASTPVGPQIAGFLATVAGTLTVTDADGTVLVNALPVAVGFNRIPLLLRTTAGGVVQLAGGAAGSLLT
jgi:hypothetical protein